MHARRENAEAPDENVNGSQKCPEIGFPPLPEGALVVLRAAAATLSN